jgi:hypothetical protein
MVETATVDDTGVEGNSRLTAVAGLVLAAMLLVEGVTVLDVRGMITLHMFLGLMLIPPVLLKCASTVYRFGSYYGGRAAYVHRGPPHIILRLLGPVVVLSSVALLGTGVWLIAIGHSSDTAVTLHQASFIVWLVAMTVHFLGHLREALVESWRDVRVRAGDRAGRRRNQRLAAIVLSLALGVGTAAVLMPSSTATFREHHDRADFRDH